MKGTTTAVMRRPSKAQIFLSFANWPIASENTMLPAPKNILNIANPAKSVVLRVFIFIKFSKFGFGITGNKKIKNDYTKDLRLNASCFFLRI
jgi:hypothetical protein